MSFRSLARDLRDSIGSLSRRRGFEVRLHSHHHGKSHGAVHELRDQPEAIQTSCWAGLPPELLRDVIKRLDDSECTWPARKSVVSCASVCRSWRKMCKEIVRCPEFSGRLTFPLSLKQPGFRDGTIQCFVKRDKSKMIYQLFLRLGPDLCIENGKFLLSAKRVRRAFCTEYVISMGADNISRSSSSYIGKVRSSSVGKYTIYDTYNSSNTGRTGHRFYSKKVSPKAPRGSYNVAQVILGPGCAHMIVCVMHSVPVSSLEPGGAVPELPPRSIEDSFRSTSISRSKESISVSFTGMIGPREETGGGGGGNGWPLLLRNSLPKWDEQSQTWCIDFSERATVASDKNFQLTVAAQDDCPSQQSLSGHDEILLQFGKVGRDLFVMDYRYPLSAFQAFAICLCKSDWKLPLQ